MLNTRQVILIACGAFIFGGFAGARLVTQDQIDTTADLRDQLAQANANTRAASLQLVALHQQMGARIAAVENADTAACQARILNVETQVRLLPDSGPAGLVLQIIEAAVKQSAANQAAKQAQGSTPASDDDLGAEAARAAGLQQ